MMKKVNPSRLALIIGTLALAFGFFAANAFAAEPGTVTMTVTAVGKKNTSPPIVTKDNVQLFLNKERTQVADWKHGEKLYLAVLIDDSLDSRQSDAGAFKRLLPVETLEYPEELVDILHVETDAIVSNEHDDFIALALGGTDLNLGLRASARKLNGVGKKVHECDSQH